MTGDERRAGDRVIYLYGLACALAILTIVARQIWLGVLS